MTADLFSPYQLGPIELANRIVMSPMTMYNSVDGLLDDYHVSYLGARAAGGCLGEPLPARQLDHVLHDHPPFLSFPPSPGSHGGAGRDCAPRPRRAPP